MENKNNQNMKFKDLKDPDRTTKTGFCSVYRHEPSEASSVSAVRSSASPPILCHSNLLHVLLSTSMDLPRVFLFPSYWDALY